VTPLSVKKELEKDSEFHLIKRRTRKDGRKEL